MGIEFDHWPSCSHNILATPTSENLALHRNLTTDPILFFVTELYMTPPCNGLRSGHLTSFFTGV